MRLDARIRNSPTRIRCVLATRTAQGEAFRSRHGRGTPLTPRGYHETRPGTTVLLLQEGVHVSGRQDVIRIRADGDVVDVVGNVGEAVIHTSRDDDDIAGAHLA